jgi:NADP-dependent 3-hydroxy acid dehydrogenase YdfG
MHFKNKVVWITGASSGIGKELAIPIVTTTSNSYSDFFECIAFEEVARSTRMQQFMFCPYDLLDLIIYLI